MGNIFRELRLNTNDGNGISVRGLAKELKISSSHISEIENDIKKPSLNELKKYHEYFNVPIELLIDNKSVFQADEVIVSQTLEFLQNNPNGQAVLKTLSEVLFGIENEDYEEGSIHKDSEYNEWHKIVYDNIEKRAKCLTNAVIMLRDPKFRKLSYNETVLSIENTIDSKKDTYSKKCKLI